MAHPAPDLVTLTADPDALARFAATTVLHGIARELLLLAGDLTCGEPWDEARRERLRSAWAAGRILEHAEIGIGGDQ
jgi:hypothetical protein